MAVIFIASNINSYSNVRRQLYSVLLTSKMGLEVSNKLSEEFELEGAIFISSEQNVQFNATVQVSFPISHNLD